MHRTAGALGCADCRIYVAPRSPLGGQITGSTRMAAVPLALPLFAVMVAEPAPTAVTTPLVETVAAAVLSLLQVTGAPEITLPDPSFTVAVRVVLSPTVRVGAPGDTATLAAAGGCTTIVAVPDWPSLLAVMVAEPGATPVTRPFASTLATLGMLLDQVIVRPVRGLCCASNTVAASCAVPGSTMVSSGGETDTDATGGGSTVMVAMPDEPPALAAICTVPGATPVTTPASLTVATDALPVFQNTFWPDTTWPLGDMTVAWRVIVLPTATLSVAGVTFTEPTVPLGAVLELHAASAMPTQARAADQRTRVVREGRVMAAKEARVRACTRIFARAGR